MHGKESRSLQFNASQKCLSCLKYFKGKRATKTYLKFASCSLQGVSDICTVQTQIFRLFHDYSSTAEHTDPSNMNVLCRTHFSVVFNGQIELSGNNAWKDVPPVC